MTGPVLGVGRRGVCHHGTVRSRYAVPLGALAAVAVGIGYSAGVELRWFRLRRLEVPILPPGDRSLRVLHISDAHLVPRQHRKVAWLRSLATLEPDLVVNTGDSISHREAVPALRRALEPLLAVPGVFVYGSNDYYAPLLKNPARYLYQPPGSRLTSDMKELPWRELGAELTAAGWIDLTQRTARLRVGGLDVQVGGIDDSHIRRDRYDEIAGTADPSADLRLGMMHSPEPRNLDRFAAEGYDLVFAGHTHGGQVRLPGYGAVVTNCGIDPHRSRGLSRHGPACLHVSAGLGTSPYAPFRFACPPEATLLTLVPRIR